MDAETIPMAKPLLGEEEKRNVLAVLEQDCLTNGPFTRRFEKKFAEYTGTKHAIATNNGTSALHTLMCALGIGDGDEVITTAYSFVASANCVSYCGGRPVFADIQPRTFNLDPDGIEGLITERTKAILPVHLFGLAAEMDPIMELAERHGLKVVEDACQAHGAEYRNKKAGSIGDAACFSFYPTKNITSSEGGMITTNDPELAEKCRMLINQGSKVKYLHECIGYNYRMTELSAAIGLAQADKIDKFNSMRIKNAEYYDSRLEGAYEVPFVPPNCKHVYHQYAIRTSDRDGAIKRLERNNIQYGIFYPRLIPEQPAYGGAGAGQYPAAQRATKELLAIPVHPSVSKEQRCRIADVLLG